MNHFYKNLLHNVKQGKAGKKMITEKDVYIAACGRDERGISKSLVKVESVILTEGGSEPNVISNMILDNPVVNIFKTRAFTMVDITFVSNDDYEFAQLMQMLSDFCKVENSMNEESGELPAICISICPKEYNGEYIVVGMHAMWALHQSKAGNGIDTIRFIIENGFMHTYQVNIDALDMEKALDEAQTELEKGIY